MAGTPFCIWPSEMRSHTFSRLSRHRFIGLQTILSEQGDARLPDRIFLHVLYGRIHQFLLCGAPRGLRSVRQKL